MGEGAEKRTNADKRLTFEEANRMEKELGCHDVVDSAFKLEVPESLCWACARSTRCYASCYTFDHIIVGCNFFLKRAKEETEEEYS